jgi:hypothetical protein
MSAAYFDPNLDMPSEPFHLPVHGLFADLSLGEGCVNLPDEFLSTPAFIQLRVLADWQQSLVQQRRRAMVELFRETSPSAADEPMSERLGRFRSKCRSLGLDCPTDFGALVDGC